MSPKKPESESPVTIGIDLGTGSLAVVARQGQNILWHKSLLLDSTTASLAERRTTRRMIRTRVAHKAREYWWNQCAKAAGIPILKEIVKVSHDTFKIGAVDNRLKKEHPSGSETICYNGALLRIMILEGQIHKLEPWQIYKAVHSAIQKRGYDPEIPWKASVIKKTSTEDESGAESGVKKRSASKKVKTTKKELKSASTQDKNSEEKESQLSSEFETLIQDLITDPSKQYCCYFDALKSGLWHPKKGITRLQQTHEAEQRAIARWQGYTPSRARVEAELLMILTKVTERYPSINPRLVMYGPSLCAYGSHPKKSEEVDVLGGMKGLIPGRGTDWEGVLGQKIPRFENRNVGYCALISRFKVCKIHDIKTLPPDDKTDSRELRLYDKFVFLSTLKNIRVLKSERVPEPLTPEECREFFHVCESPLRATKTQLKTWLDTKDYKLAPGSIDSIGRSRSSGRCAYSRPALRMICRSLYEGWSRSEMEKHLVSEFVGKNTDPLKGLTLSDLKWIGLLTNEGWSQSFYVPFQTFEVKGQNKAEEFLRTVKYPVVKHRLHLLLKILLELQEFLKVQKIDWEKVRIGLEVISDESRQSFLGEKAKLEISARIRRNTKINHVIQEACVEFGLKGRKNFEKVKLAYAQGFVDPYDVFSSGKSKDLDDKKRRNIMLHGIKKELYDIDHIVPESLGGPDEFYNKILTKSENNRNQKKRLTPYAWLHKAPAWNDYLRIVESLPSKTADKLGLSFLTKQLLTSPNAVELVNKRTDLQATGYIEKAAQRLIYLAFGWPEPQTKGSARRVVCIPGSMLARIRGEHELNELLYPRDNVEKKKSKKVQSSPKKKRTGLSPVKNRDNPKHHILDAAVLTFVPEWARNPQKNKFFRLPVFAKPKWFQNKLILEHEPEVINVSKPSIFATRKSLRVMPGSDKKYVTVKKHIHSGNTSSVEWTYTKLKKAVECGDFNDPPGHKDSKVTKTLKAAMRRKADSLPELVTQELGEFEVPIWSLKSIEEFSPYRHLVDEFGGIIESENHKGVIVWRMREEKNWKVAVVAAWSDSKITLEKLFSEYGKDLIELWNGGKTLKRGDMVEIRTKALKKLPMGRYVVSSTRENGQIEFRGKEELVVVNKLISAGDMRVIRA